jgi:hypothetical protein
MCKLISFSKHSAFFDAKYCWFLLPSMHYLKKSTTNKTYVPFPDTKELYDKDYICINKTEYKKLIEN